MDFADENDMSWFCIKIEYIQFKIWVNMFSCYVSDLSASVFLREGKRGRKSEVEI